MAETQRRAWDRLDDEGQDEWELFETFLRERDLRRAAELHFDADQVFVGLTYVTALSKRRRWPSRVAAYDRWITSIKDDALATMVRREIRAIGTRKVKLLRKMQRIVDKVADQVYPPEAVREFAIKINDAVQFGKISQVLLEEYRHLEEANPSPTVENPYSQELSGALERVKAAAEASRGRKAEELPAASLEVPAVSADPSSQMLQ